MVTKRKVVGLLILLIPFVMIYAGGAQQKEATEGMPYAGQVIRIAIFDSPDKGDRAEALVPAFEAATGAKVEYERIPWVGMHEKYVTSLTGGRYVYDVMEQVYRTELEFAQYYEDLGPFIAKDPEIMEDMVGIALKYGALGNRRHGVPINFSVTAVDYRKDIFKDAGLMPNPKWDFDEYLATIKKLETDDRKGIVLEGVAPQLIKHFLGRFWGLGGHLFTRDWQPTPQRAEAIRALEHLKATFALAPDGSLALTPPEAINIFIQGRAAMLEGWTGFTWGPAQDPEKSRIVDKWGVLPIPGGSSQIAGPWGWCIPQSAKQKDLAWEWIKMNSSTAAQKEGLIEFGLIPAKGSVYTDPEVLQKIPWMKEYLVAAEGGIPLPRIKTVHVMIEAMNDRISAYLAGTKSAAQVIDECVPIWKEQVELAKPEHQYTADY